MIRSLDALRVFVAVARNQSMTAAADELFVTPGAVSKRIRELEAELGMPLFDRQHRQLVLTPRGNELHAVCRQLFLSLKTTLDDLDGGQAESRALVVSCEPTITMQWLIPRLPSFYEQRADIEIHLYAAGGAIDFWGSGIDLALRRDDFIWDSSIYSEPIAREVIGPVCSPTLEQPAGKNHRSTLLHTSSRPNAWSRWNQRSNTNLGAGRSVTFEHFYLSLQAARAALGLAIGSIYMVYDQLASGELVAPYGFLADGSQYCLLSATPVEEDERKIAFRDWIREELAETKSIACNPTD